MILPLSILFCYGWKVCKLMKLVSTLASAFQTGKTVTEPTTSVKVISPPSGPKSVYLTPNGPEKSQGAPRWCELGCPDIRPFVKNSRNLTCKACYPRQLLPSLNKIVNAFLNKSCEQIPTVHYL